MPDNLQGHILLAAPSMLDPNFERTVILLVEHGEAGALGLVLNKPTPMRVQDALPESVEHGHEVEDVLRKGGPCEGPLMVLHGSAEASQVEVLPGVHFATEQDLVERVMEAADASAMYFAGYAGWGPGQLESEIGSDAWLVLEGRPDEVFGAGAETWPRLVRTLAKEAVKQTMNPNIVPSDPTLN